MCGLHDLVSWLIRGGSRGYLRGLCCTSGEDFESPSCVEIEREFMRERGASLFWSGEEEEGERMAIASPGLACKREGWRSALWSSWMLWIMVWQPKFGRRACRWRRGEFVFRVELSSFLSLHVCCLSFVCCGDSDFCMVVL